MRTLIVMTLFPALTLVPLSPPASTAQPGAKMTVSRMQAILSHPTQGTPKEWKHIDSAIDAAGGMLTYEDGDGALPIESLIVRKSSNDLRARGGATQKGPCSGHPSYPHRRTDSAGAPKVNIGYKAKITCTRPMSYLGYNSVLFRQRWNGAVGSVAEGTAKGWNNSRSSYEDKKVVFACKSDKQATWRVIYEYQYKEAGCACNPTIHFVVKTSYAKVACGGVAQ